MGLACEAFFLWVSRVYWRPENIIRFVDLTMLIDPKFDRLLASVYQGPMEEEPWQGFLSEL